MLRTTITKIRKVCTTGFIPRVLCGDHCTPVSYAVIRTAPKSTKASDGTEKDGADIVLGPGDELRIDTIKKNDGNEIIANHKRPLSRQERCQKVIDEAFGTGKSTDDRERVQNDLYCYHSVNTAETKREIIESEKAAKLAEKKPKLEPAIIVDDRTEYGMFQMSRELIIEDEVDEQKMEKQNMSSIREPNLDMSLENLEKTHKEPMQLKGAKAEKNIDKDVIDSGANKVNSNIDTQATEMLKLHHKEVNKADTPNIVNATTTEEHKEGVTQKLESIEETPLVETTKPDKIEGFNVAPKVLENMGPTYNISSSGNVTLLSGDFSDALDEVAKRCLHSPVGKIDEMLINELENLEVHTTCNTGSKSPAVDIEDDLVRMNVFKNTTKQAKRHNNKDHVNRFHTSVEPMHKRETKLAVLNEQTEETTLRNQEESLRDAEVMLNEVSPIASHNPNFPKIVIEPSVNCNYTKDVSGEQEQLESLNHHEHTKKIIGEDDSPLINNIGFFRQPQELPLSMDDVKDKSAEPELPAPLKSRKRENLYKSDWLDLRNAEELPRENDGKGLGIQQQQLAPLQCHQHSNLFEADNKQFINNSLDLKNAEGLPEKEISFSLQEPSANRNYAKHVSAEQKMSEDMDRLTVEAVDTAVESNSAKVFNPEVVLLQSSHDVSDITNTSNNTWDEQPTPVLKYYSKRASYRGKKRKYGSSRHSGYWQRNADHGSEEGRPISSLHTEIVNRQIAEPLTLENRPTPESNSFCAKQEITENVPHLHITNIPYLHDYEKTNFTNLYDHSSNRHDEESHYSEQFGQPLKGQSEYKTVLQDIDPTQITVNKLFPRMSFRNFSLPSSKWDVNIDKQNRNKVISSCLDEVQQKTSSIEEANPNTEQVTVKAILPNEILEQSDLTIMASPKRGLAYQKGISNLMESEDYQAKQFLGNDPEMKYENSPQETQTIVEASPKPGLAYQKSTNPVDVTEEIESEDYQVKRSLDYEHPVMKYENSPTEAQTIVDASPKPGLSYQTSTNLVDATEEISSEDYQVKRSLDYDYPVIKYENLPTETHSIVDASPEPGLTYQKSTNLVDTTEETESEDYQPKRSLNYDPEVKYENSPPETQTIVKPALDRLSNQDENVAKAALYNLSNLSENAAKPALYNLSNQGENFVKPAFDNLSDQGENFAKPALDNLSNQGENAAKHALDHLSNQGENFAKPTLDSLSDQGENFAKPALDHRSDHGENFVKPVPDHLSDHGENFVKPANDHLSDHGVNFVKPALDNLSNQGEYAAKHALDHLSDRGENFAKPALDHLSDHGENFAKPALDHLSDHGENFVKPALDHLSDRGTNFAKPALDHLSDHGENVAKPALDHLSDQGENAAKPVLGHSSNQGENVAKPVFGHLSNQGENAAKPALDNLSNQGENAAKPALDNLSNQSGNAAKLTLDNWSKLDENVAKQALDNLPNLNEDVSLSELLRRVRLRNRIMSLISGNKLMVQVDPVVGKCHRKAPRCPPTAPRSPPMNPVPPPPLGLPMLKPKPPACKPKRKPKSMKCSVCDFPHLCGVQIEDSASQEMELVYDLLVNSSQADNEVIDRFQSLGWTLTEVLRQVQSKIETMFARDYEPWVPIPSWPRAKKVEKRKSQPGYSGAPPSVSGCPVFPKALSTNNPEPPCLPKSCEGFPRRTFSMLDCFPVSLGKNQVYDLGQF